METNRARDRQVAIVRRYFELVDRRDPALLDLFTEDCQFFFPKFGVASGKESVALFGERIGSELRSLAHAIDDFVYTVDGSRVVVEGQERGVTNDGVSWPDGVVSTGRFCNVFELEGDRIARCFIYVDPDFTSSDAARVSRYAGASAGEAKPDRGSPPGAVASNYLAAVQAYYAEPGPAALDGLLALFSEDADWDIAGDTAHVPHIGPRRGRAAIGAFFRQLVEVLEPERFEVTRVLSDGERAVVLGSLASRVRTTKKLIESEFAIHLTVEDGLITRYRLLEDSFAVSRAVAP